MTNLRAFDGLVFLSLLNLNYTFLINCYGFLDFFLWSW
jgi:hypothetical protein